MTPILSPRPENDDKNSNLKLSLKHFLDETVRHEILVDLCYDAKVKEMLIPASKSFQFVILFVC